MLRDARTFLRSSTPVILMALVVAGCDRVGNPIDVLTGKRTKPDEFQVIARDELRLPGSLAPSSLPIPTPGATSPLDPDPQADAIAALAGTDTDTDTDTGTDTGTLPQPTRTTFSRGEAELLAAANASAADPAIRQQIATENVQIEADKPYEPPTIVELFSGDKGFDDDDVINPDAEARRLQETGADAPVNPAALSAEAEADAARTEQLRAEEAAAARPEEPPLPRGQLRNEAPVLTLE